MRHALRASTCAATVALALSATRPAHAEGSRPDWAFGQPGAEVGVATFTAAANLTYFLPQHAGDWGAELGPDVDADAEAWSDVFGSVGGALVATGTGYALESGYLSATDAEQPGVQALYATMVETESLLLTSAITQTVKRLVGRCRPRARRPGGCDEHDAFPSGHTSSAAAYAGARIYRLATTDLEPAFGLRVAALGLAEASTLTVAVLRVFAGAHSWEDVLVGAAVGHATGLLVAAAHPPVPVDRTPAPATTREQRVYFEWGFGF